MMNLYGDDRLVYGEKNNQRYKKGVITGKIVSLFFHLNPVYHAEITVRNNRIRKIESAIKNADYKDTESLKKIQSTIIKYDLENNIFGKAIQQKYIENFVTKAIKNNNGILSQDMIDYYLIMNPKYNNERNEKHNVKRFSKELKGKIKAAYQSSILGKSILARQITKKINEVNSNETEELKEIYRTMVENDLDSIQFGKYLSNKTILTFIKKVEQNNNQIIDKESINFMRKEFAENNKTNKNNLEL